MSDNISALSKRFGISEENVRILGENFCNPSWTKNEEYLEEGMQLGYDKRRGVPNLEKGVYEE